MASGARSGAPHATACGALLLGALAGCGVASRDEAPVAAPGAPAPAAGASPVAPAPVDGRPPARPAQPLADELRALRVVLPDGSTTTVGEVLGGAPAVVAFWATYCPPCRLEVPVLARAVPRLAAAGVRLLAVATDGEDTDRVRRAVEEWEITYPTLRAAPGEEPRLARLLPDGLPATAVIGPDGALRRDAFLDDAALDALVRAAVGR